MNKVDTTGKKLITVESVGTLSELGGISGPVINPFYIDMSTLNRLLSNRRKVYEVNPKNKNERVRLSLKNMRIKNFVEKNIPEPAHVNISVDKKESTNVSEKTKELANDTDMIVPKTDTNPLPVTNNKKDSSEKKTDTTQKSDFTKK